MVKSAQIIIFILTMDHTTMQIHQHHFQLQEADVQTGLQMNVAMYASCAIVCLFNTS